MKPLFAMGLAALIALGSSGCVYVNGERINPDDWRDTQEVNRKQISELTLGMPRSQVIDRLGTPNDSEAFQHDGEEVRVLFYRTQRKHSDGETTRDETTPLVFKNDRLIGWGQGVYDEMRF